MVKYRCFKLSCNLVPNSVPDTLSAEELRARLERIMNRDLSKTDTKFAIPPHFVLGLTNEACIDELIKLHSISAYRDNLFKCAYDPKEDRLVIFVQDATGEIVGAVGRKLSYVKGEPRTRNYMDSRAIPFKAGSGRTLVLTEDVFSAIACTRHKEFTGEALLGTDFTNDYIEDLLKYEQVLICLDPDAKIKALTLKRLLTFYVSNVKIWTVTKDIKNMSDEEFFDSVAQLNEI
jgi:DNA primase